MGILYRPPPIELILQLGIAIRTFVPLLPNGDHIVVANATGGSQGYCKHFAAWMAERGYHVTTFDYSGIGASRKGSLCRHPATATSWAEHDLTEVIDHVHRIYAPKRIMGLGHSIGGQFFCICKVQDKLSALVLIVSQHGHFRNWDLPHRRRIAFQWLVMPLTFTSVFGCFPGERLGVMEDLRPGMGREWVKWVRSPGYLFDHVSGARERHANIRVPLLFWSFSDDRDLAPERAADELAKHYVNCSVTHEHIRPSDLGVEAIGHFGFFKKGGEGTLWPALLSAMESKR